ncbi:MAG TPA: M64 family metallopeptidase [Planctomycetota bacterium]
MTNRHRILAVLAATAIFGAPAAGQSGPDEEKGWTEIEKAEQNAEKGEYATADQRYRNIARRYKGSEPGAVALRRAQPNGFLGSKLVVDHGPSANRVDVVLMGDGYLLKKQESFDRLMESIPKFFERDPVFREYWNFLNVRRANVKSADDQVGGFGREADTAFRGGASGLSGGQVRVDHGRVRAALGELPEHDGLALVFVKSGSHGTGGGGIAAVGGRPSRELVLHEFGHAFGGLADEYSDDVGYKGDVGVAPNLSDSPDPAEAPWRHWLDAGVKGVGVHEGAAGRAKNAYKPTVRGCMMDHGSLFCPVCREVMVLRVYSLVDPIDAAAPEAHGFDAADRALALAGALPHEFELTVLQPASHALDVAWYLFRAEEAPVPPDAVRDRSGDRRARGPLPPIDAEAAAVTHPNARGMHRFKVDPDDLEPGLWRLVVRVRDQVLPAGEKVPWVLLDPRGLLESERGWWIQVEPN